MVVAHKLFAQVQIVFASLMQGVFGILCRISIHACVVYRYTHVSYIDTHVISPDSIYPKTKVSSYFVILCEFWKLRFITHLLFVFSFRVKLFQFDFKVYSNLMHIWLRNVNYSPLNMRITNISTFEVLVTIWIKLGLLHVSGRLRVTTGSS